MLILRVKVAHSFLHSVSNQFHFIILNSLLFSPPRLASHILLYDHVDHTRFHIVEIEKQWKRKLPKQMLSP